MSTVVEVENLGKLERKMVLSFARAELAQEKSVRLAKLSKTVRMPGFRPGKVPMKVIERQYGPQVELEAQFDRAARLFFEVAREQSLRVVGQPQLQPRVNDEPEQIVFDALFEVYPEITIGDFSKLELTRIQTTIGEAEIDRTINVLREQRAHFHSRGAEGAHGAGGEDMTARDGDRVTADFVGTIDGVEFAGGKADDFVFVLGQGRMLPEFEQAVRGTTVGQHIVFDLTFPEDYNNKELAGKLAQFSLTVRQIEWPHLPELDEAFAQSLGIGEGGIEKMRGDIRQNLEREVKRRASAMLKNQVMEGLLSSAHVDVPRALLEQEQLRLVEMARQDMEGRGMANARSMPISPDMFLEQATRRVKLGLILGEVVRTQHLAVKPEQVEAEIADLAQSYQDPEEIKRWYKADRARQEGVEAAVLEDNVVEFVCARATLQDKALSFEELTAAGL
ncbi:MAG: trigger factor [Ottowia sp.]|nr:trigger factor [Ottowia sp.]